MVAIAGVECPLIIESRWRCNGCVSYCANYCYRCVLGYDLGDMFRACYAVRVGMTDILENLTLMNSNL